MLSVYGYKTKKDLKAAIGRHLQIVETSMFGPEFKPDGRNVIVGPAPTVRKWYAQVDCQAGVITKVT